MKRIFAALSVALFAVAFCVVAKGAGAAGADPAAAAITGFYDTLLGTMKAGGTVKSRYDRLKPAIERAFDLQGMTALSVGPTWDSISAADQKALVEAFERMTVANYASNFDSYGGQKFTVDPAVLARGDEKFVKSTMTQPHGDPIAFNYRMHQVGSDWKVLDVYLAGNISQLAQKRADFAATLASGGPEGLAKQINALADRQLGG